MKKVWAVSNEFISIQKKYEGKINDLMAKYMNENKPSHNPGEVINFPAAGKGYCRMEIKTVVPEINWADKKVRYKAIGIFTGDDPELIAMEGKLYLDELKADTPLTEDEDVMPSSEKSDIGVS